MSTVAGAPGTTTTTLAPADLAPTTVVGPPDTTHAATTTFPPPTTTFPPPTTTIPPPTTRTTLDPAQLASLVLGLDGDVARARAISDYLAARAAIAQVSPGKPAPSTVDPVLAKAAATQLGAAGAQIAAEQRYNQVRRGMGQVALAIYLGEQAPSSSPLGGSLAERAAVLSAVLDSKQRQLRAANQELARAIDTLNNSRALADRAVQARTIELQTVAAAVAAPTTPHTTPPTTAAPRRGPVPPNPPAGESSRLVGPSVLGPSVLSADELAGWYTSTGHHANLTVPLAVLAGEYLSVGATDGVRPDIAFAQSMVETGYFGFPGYGQVAVGDNNFAGIGACDTCASGFRFPDAGVGVMAQLQLLHAYATAAQPVPGPLPGPFRVAGCCPTWMALTGVWATAPDYGVAILKTYRAMVKWALARRSAAAGL